MLGDELGEIFSYPLTVGTCSDEDHRTLCGLETIDQDLEHLLIDLGSADLLIGHRCIARDLFGCDIFGEFDADGSGSFHFGKFKCLSDCRWDTSSIHDECRSFRDRLHHADHIDDLELSLFRRFDRLLSGDGDDRHGTEMSIGDTRDHIGRSWAEGRKCDSWLPCHPPVGRSHEDSSLFVPRDDEADAGCPERFEEIEVLFTWHTEDIFYSLIDEACDEEIGVFHYYQKSNINTYL